MRTYGVPPYKVVVLHGGPGALGSMAPVARALAAEWGVLEPLLTALSVEGQIEELRALLDRYADPLVTLIGSSWGAMLGYIFTARYPAVVGKLLMVGSGPLEARYAAGIDEVRRNRLTEDERRREDELLAALDDPAVEDKDAVFAELGKLSGRSDTYDPVDPGTDGEEDITDARYEVFAHVWPEAAKLRASGQLLEIGRQIRCPVVAIHGAYDPHPGEGIREPLARILSDFRFISLPRCGHEPWTERYARDDFFRMLDEELRGRRAG